MSMSVLIASFIVLTMGLSYAILLQRKLAETIFLAVVSIVGILYCFGLMNREGSLLYGVYAVVVFAILSGALCVFVCLRKREKLANLDVISGVLLYAFFLIISLFMNYERTFQHWDEFSHWGMIVRHYYHFDAFGTVGDPYSVLLAPNYPPGTSLFQYFFVRFSERFTEYYTYIAMNIMYFSMIMPFIKNLFKKKQWIHQSLLLVVFILLPLVFPLSFYGSLLVDVMAGLIFGLAIVYYFLFKYEASSYGVYLVAAATFLLTLVQSTGVLFAIGVCVIVLADIVFMRRKEVAIVFVGKEKLFPKIRFLLLLFLPIISMGFAKITWLSLQVQSGLPSNTDILTARMIIRFLTGSELGDYQKQTRLNFFVAMFTRTIPEIGFSNVTISIIFAVALFSLLYFYKDKKNNNKQRRFILGGLLLLFGFYVYQFIFALLYVYIFCSFEGPNLASFERYMTTYILGMVLFIVMLILQIPSMIGQEHFKRWKEIMPERFVTFHDLKMTGRILSFFFICMASFWFLIHASSNGLEGVMLARFTNSHHFQPRPTAVAAERWMDYFIEKPPYFIDQRSNGHSYWRMKYELWPYTRLANIRRDYSISPEPFFGPPQFASDPWTFVVTPEKWEEHVLHWGYERVFIFRSDETLETYFNHFFVGGVQEGMVYDVVEENGSLLLIPVVTEE